MSSASQTASSKAVNQCRGGYSATNRSTQSRGTRGHRRVSAQRGVHYEPCGEWRNVQSKVG